MDAPKGYTIQDLTDALQAAVRRLEYYREASDQRRNRESLDQLPADIRLGNRVANYGENIFRASALQGWLGPMLQEHFSMTLRSVEEGWTDEQLDAAAFALMCRWAADLSAKVWGSSDTRYADPLRVVESQQAQVVGRELAALLGVFHEYRGLSPEDVAAVVRDRQRRYEEQYRANQKKAREFTLNRSGEGEYQLVVLSGEGEVLAATSVTAGTKVAARRAARDWLHSSGFAGLGESQA
jgi:hypothetical protein